MKWEKLIKLFQINCFDGANKANLFHKNFDDR